MKEDHEWKSSPIGLAQFDSKLFEIQAQLVRVIRWSNCVIFKAKTELDNWNCNQNSPPDAFWRRAPNSGVLSSTDFVDPILARKITMLCSTYCGLTNLPCVC